MAVKTYGLTHAAIAVRDLQRTADFYRAVFGAVTVYESDGPPVEGFVRLQTPVDPPA